MKVLVYTIAFDPPDSSGCRQMARMLASSAARTYLEGDFIIVHNSREPIFRVQRYGIDEIFVETAPLEHQPLADLGNRWKFQASSVLDPSGYDVVCFLDADCLVLKNCDHLFEEPDWDILYQPERGRPIQDGVFNGYLTDAEMKTLSISGRNAGTWAVRAEIYKEVMHAWEKIMSSTPEREERWKDQTAWNRLLLNAETYGWRTKPFKADEIQFPLHLNKSWLSYRRASIIHCLGTDNLKKIEFMFGVYIQTFFHDLKGTLVNIFDM